MLDYCEPRRLLFHHCARIAQLRTHAARQEVAQERSDFACEACLQRLRDVINKNITEDDVLHAVDGV